MLTVRSAGVLVSLLLALSSTRAEAVACADDNDCPLGWVCETTVLGDCSNPNRECTPGCRAGARACAGTQACIDRTCKTCPCPDLCATPQACAPPPAGLAAWWPFDTTAGIAAADLSGNLNLGTYHGSPQLTPGVVAGALDFNGVDSFVQVSHSPSIGLTSGRFTLDFWIRPAPGEVGGTIFRKGVLGPSHDVFLGGDGFHLYYLSGHFYAFFDGLLRDLTPTVTDHALPDVWTFVAVTIDLPGNIAKLYINGLLAKPTPLGSTTSSTVANTQPILIGGSELGPGDRRFFAGSLDELELVDRVLSEQEIRSIFLAQSSGKCKPDHLKDGKVVFSSDRVKPPQLFIKQVGLPAPPTQVTSMTSVPFGARHARWSRNGKYIVYITSDVIVGSESHQVDKLVIIDEKGAQKMYLLSGRFGATSLGYPQWSDDGQSIVVLFAWSTGARGLGIIRFAAPYQFTSPVTLVRLLNPGQIPNLNPGEPIFSRDGSSVYFAADANAPGQLYQIPVTGGTPAPISLSNGMLIRRAYAPSLSPDGTRLLFNSEMWREDPAHYQDEELLELGLLTLVIRRVTAEPGNQYGWFAKNGAGEMLVQSNNPATGKYGLYLEENGIRVPLDVADPNNISNESGDWWKPFCGGAPVLWAAGEAVGCKFPTWGPEQKSLCASWTPLLPSGNGSCALCADSQWIDPILKGAWSSLTEGTDVATAQPADLSCRGCVSPPDKLAGWWPLDELSGTVAADLSASAANGTHVGGATPVPGRVKTGLKLDGKDAYVQIPSSTPLNVDTGNFSLEAWVKIESQADLSGTRVIAEKRQQAPWRGYSFFLSNGRPALQIADGLGSQYSNYLSSTQVPADGAWHLVTVTVSRANPVGGNFYLDGNPVGSPFDPTGRKGTLTNNRPLRLGSLSPAAPGSLFKGSLDEVTLYKRVLTPYEVRSLYLAGPFGKCKP